jgi:hypothetical protein
MPVAFKSAVGSGTRDARPHGIHLLLTYPEGCRARCACCGLSAGIPDTGRADRLRYIRSNPATEADLFQDGTPAHLDGEPAAIGTFVRFRFEPRGLPVIVP